MVFLHIVISPFPHVTATAVDIFFTRLTLPSFELPFVSKNIVSQITATVLYIKKHKNLLEIKKLLIELLKLSKKMELMLGFKNLLPTFLVQNIILKIMRL